MFHQTSIENWSFRVTREQGFCQGSSPDDGSQRQVLCEFDGSSEGVKVVELCPETIQERVFF